MTPAPPNPRIHESWKAVLMPAFEAASFQRLKAFLNAERHAGKTHFPPGSRIFSAFDSTPFDAVKVVLLGQDPYHGPGQANGLCFSVGSHQALPPSLVNIFKEYQSDLGLSAPSSGDLTPWAQQGVLLLNATLTVEAHRAGSHQKQGWEEFTDAAISVLNQQRDGLVFILWGSYAQKKALHIDLVKHRIIRSPHPSPLSAHRGFFGSRPFSRTNTLLMEMGQSPIDWSLG